MADGHERSERITLASTISLGLEESLNQLRCVGDERFGVLVYGRDSPHSVLSHIGVAVVKARTSGGEERLEELGLAELAQEAKGVTADELVRMLEVISNSVAVQALLTNRQS